MASTPAFLFATGIGLFDLNRRIRPVGEAYNKLIADWRQDYSEGCIVKWRETAEREEEHIPTEPAKTRDFDLTRRITSQIGLWISPRLSFMY